MKITPVVSGLACGLTAIVISLLFYIGGVELFMNRWLSTLIWLIPLVVGVVMAVNARKQQGGYMSYGKAYSFLLIAMIISVLLNTVFSYIMFEIIDPQFMVDVQDRVIEKLVADSNASGMSDENIEQAVSFTEKIFEGQKSMFGKLIGLVISIVMGALISLLTALIVRKNPPEFA